MDLITQESTTSFFSQAEMPSCVVYIPNGRISIEKLSENLMDNLKKKKYDMVADITRGPDITGSENIIEILDFFQDTNRILFNFIGNQIWQKGMKLHNE